MALTLSEVKRLFGESAGLCNICKERVVEEDYHFGEQAHIIAQGASGPRANFDSLYPIDSYGNHILLCPNCHRRVDKAPEKFPPSYLHAKKNEHLEWVKRTLDTSASCRKDESALECLAEFIPFCNLSRYMESLPQTYYLNMGDLSYYTRIFARDNMHLYPFSDQTLQDFFEALLGVQFEVDGIVAQLPRSDCFGDLENRVSLYANTENDRNLMEKLESIGTRYIKTHAAFMQYCRNTYPKVNLGKWRLMTYEECLG
ncbi:HNH endonuclease signature motif containing protein [Halodesulfovibrio aestuarii]|uniref:HNH endonuclease n=1 Tax=Halodesulfovibrio aestuarii TaxID=126333 RepID=UPI00042A1D73